MSRVAAGKGAVVAVAGGGFSAEAGVLGEASRELCVRGSRGEIFYNVVWVRRIFLMSY